MPGRSDDFVASKRIAVPSRLATWLRISLITVAMSAGCTLGLGGGLFGAGASAQPTGALFAWGDNTDGALGDGTTISSSTAEFITLAPGVTPIAIAAGDDSSYAIGSDHNLYAWGDNAAGQLGDGTTGDQARPEEITPAPGVTPTTIAASGLGEAAYAIGSNGNLYAWGDNGHGQLGDGTTNDADAPEVSTLAPGVHATAITSGYLSAFAIGSDGNLYGWGDNEGGQLADGTTTQHNTPEVISLPHGVHPTAIAATYDSAYAIGDDGLLYAWGYNDYGELGDGTTNSSDTPELITLAAGVTPLAVAGRATENVYAIGSDHNLYAWGNNNSGELGDGNQGVSAKRVTPEEIPLAPGVTPTAVAGGNETSFALGSDEKLYSWGNEAAGALGNGMSGGTQPTPEAITLPSGVTPTRSPRPTSTLSPSVPAPRASAVSTQTLDLVVPRSRSPEPASKAP
jgi:alpha-tubulin suppressor-like RCC1 family protein